MRQILSFLLVVVVFAAGVSAQDNPLKKSARGDWAKYLITTKNETVPLLSQKDQPRWRAVTNIADEFVRVDEYIMFGERRSGAGASAYNFKERYEPVPGIVKGANIKIISTSKDKLTIAGKQYECTKIVRKVDQALDESKVQSSWIGTSTLWLCDKLPLGLAKMENTYQIQLMKGDEAQKITETWVLAESGFKNWKED